VKLVGLVVVPNGLPVTANMKVPVAEAEIVRILAAPAAVGVTGFVANEHVTPAGGETQERLTA
jgi:hypothetical protein